MQSWREVLGPLAGTLPRGVMVLICLVGFLAAARAVTRGIRGGRTLLLLAAWASAMGCYVAGSVVFGAFAWNAPITFDAARAFVAMRSAPLAAVLLLGTLAAAGIEFTRPSTRRGVPSSKSGAGDPPDRASAVGALGEALVVMELRALGWPALQDVVLARPGWSVEIDHVVRAPDGIVIVETKTLSGVVWGQPGGQCWYQQAGGEVRSFRNPLSQNETHMGAVRSVIGDADVSLRGLVVSAGRARFALSIEGAVVPVRDLGRTLRESCAVPAAGQAAIDAAWAVLVVESSQSAGRRAAHVAYARSRACAGPG
jgi:hypothetical protein